VRWCCGSAQHHRRGMNMAPELARLPGLCLEAVIDGTQTGPRVCFDISEPPQEGAREWVNRLIGDRCFIPVANSWTLPLCLPDLAPANFLGIGHIGAAHFETFFEVRVLVIRPGVSQFCNAVVWCVAITLLSLAGL
jgi:hypothetical protein